ncbi:MAG TPA: tryptophan synthase subunit alpha [Acidimicrobiia bacterium]|nr:tryptophan synthase subunit alpha [Acidimicrobiia bacterium]
MSASLRRELIGGRRQGRTSLIGYLPVGYPTPTRFLELVEAASSAGIDALELGLPVAEPESLDGEGPIIREALAVASAQCDSELGFELLAEVRSLVAVPLVALIYSAEIEETPIGRFLESCRSAGADAVLVPDLRIESQLDVALEATSVGLEVVVFLASPNQGHLVRERSGGLVGYLASSTGSTGGHLDPDTVSRRVARLRQEAPSLPLIVGFGVWSTSDAVAVAEAGADGVAIGSALVRSGRDGPGHMGELVRAASSALRDAEGAYGT